VEIYHIYIFSHKITLIKQGSTVIDEEIDTHQIDLVESVSEVDSSKNKDFENSSKVDKVEEASKRLLIRKL
jgi:hypothetical protein